MDLNEKIEARRKELRLKEQADANLAKAVASQNFSQQQLVNPNSSEAIENKRRILAEAKVRAHGKTDHIFGALVLLGIGGFFIKWWVGLLFLFFALGRHTSVIAKYEKEIIDEENEIKWEERVRRKD